MEKKEITEKDYKVIQSNCNLDNLHSAAEMFPIKSNRSEPKSLLVIITSVDISFADEYRARSNSEYSND